MKIFFFLPLTISSFNVNTKYIQSRRATKPSSRSQLHSGRKKKIYLHEYTHAKKQSMPHSQRHSVVLRNALALMLLLATRMNVHSYGATILHKSRHLHIHVCLVQVLFYLWFREHVSPTVLAGLKRMREWHATTQMVLPLSQYTHMEQLANSRAVCRHKVYNDTAQR